MSDKRQNSRQTLTDAAALRKRAEEQDRSMEPTSLSAQTPEEIERVFHELRVHQIELDMQNEELRTAQVEIEARRARYFDLYNLAPVGYCTLSEKGLILEANLTVAGLLGVTRDALVKQPLSRFVLKEDQDIYYLHRKQLFESGEAQDCDLRMMKKDGTPFWAHLRGTTAQDGDGTPLCRAVISDITERIQAKNAIDESEIFAQATLDALSAHLAILDEKGTIITVNSAWRAFAQANGEDYSSLCEGANYLAVCETVQGIESEEAAAFGAGLRAVLDGNLNEFTLEYACHSASEKRWFIGRVTRFKKMNSLYLVIAHENVTPRKQAEMEILALNRHLEQRVANRTDELATANQMLEDKVAELEMTQESLQELFAKYRIVADNTYDWEYWLDADGNFMFCSPSCKRTTGYEPEDFIDDPDLQRRILHPDDLLMWKKHRSEAPHEKGGKLVEFRILHADGSTRWIGHICQPIYDNQGNYLGTRGSNRDITKHKQADEAVHKHTAQAEALLRAATRLNAQLDLDTLLQTVCQEAAAALHAPAAWINLYDPHQDMLCFSSEWGMPSEFKDRYRPVPRADYNTHIALTEGIVVFQDIQTLTAIQNWDLYKGLDIRTVAFTSMNHNEQLIGAISVISYSEVRHFSQDELSSLQGLANQAALAIVNTRLFEQVSAGRQRLRTLAQALIELQETERRSMALELHDQLGQMLSSTKMSLDMIPSLPPAAAEEQIQRARTLIADMVTRVRLMALDLRPSMLDDMGLLPTLNWHFKNFQAQSGIAVSFEHSGMEHRFPPQMEITAYRIIQEALTNVMRHARSEQVSINAWADKQSLNLQIRDNGVGFDPKVSQSQNESSGLSGMRERARLLGGELVIESEPGAGTSLTASLPLALSQERN